MFVMWSEDPSDDILDVLGRCQMVDMVGIID